MSKLDDVVVDGGVMIGGAFVHEEVYVDGAATEVNLSLSVSSEDLLGEASALHVERAMSEAREGDVSPGYPEADLSDIRRGFDDLVVTVVDED